jgi:pyruvate formate lyase activating enzyme
MSEIRGLVTDTIAFSNVDGPGNRFVVFLQGCNFNCVACHNPHTINVCTDCGECVTLCPSGALTLGALGQVVWDAATCAAGDTCLTMCPYDASPKARSMEVVELLALIRKAAPFLSGITVSGGEATQQPAFVHALFRAVKADPKLTRLSCFIDSNGSADPAAWANLAPVTDGTMIDLKCLDNDIHRSMTGHSNEPVLAAIRQLHASGLLYEVRLLLIAGVNDDPMLLRRTAEWLAAIDPVMRVKVIGFRRHGSRPRRSELAEPSHAELLAVAELLQSISGFDISVI